MSKSTKTYILVTTGAGNTIVGGADIWVNNFLKEVWNTLPNKKSYKLLIDSKRPADFNENSLPKGLQFHFHFDDPSKTEQWLANCSYIHFLHPHYHHRPHIWKWEDKFGVCFVHAYPREIQGVLSKLPEIDRLQSQTKIDLDFYDEFLLTCRRRVWIGINSTEMSERFPNYTYTIPNYYEFRGPAPLSTHYQNGSVGFAARAETRKCLHWMNGIEKGYALTSWRDVVNMRETTNYTFPTIQVYQWEPNILHAFYTKNWGIFHGASFNEPFGYSIFQAVDYGKIPIINKDWAPELDYKYRVSTKNEFDICIKKIKKSDINDVNIERNKLIEFMKKFDNKEIWVDRVRSQILFFD